MSQVFDIGLSFCFVTHRKLIFIKIDEKSQKLGLNANFETSFPA